MMGSRHEPLDLRSFTNQLVLESLQIRVVR